MRVEIRHAPGGHAAPAGARYATSPPGSRLPATSPSNSVSSDTNVLLSISMSVPTLPASVAREETSIFVGRNRRDTATSPYMTAAEMAATRQAPWVCCGSQQAHEAHTTNDKPRATCSPLSSVRAATYRPSLKLRSTQVISLHSKFSTGMGAHMVSTATGPDGACGAVGDPAPRATKQGSPIASMDVVTHTTGRLQAKTASKNGIPMRRWRTPVARHTPARQTSSISLPARLKRTRQERTTRREIRTLMVGSVIPWNSQTHLVVSKEIVVTQLPPARSVQLFGHPPGSTQDQEGQNSSESGFTGRELGKVMYTSLATTPEAFRTVTKRKCRSPTGVHREATLTHAPAAAMATTMSKGPPRVELATEGTKACSRNTPRIRRLLTKATPCNPRQENPIMAA
mmetsp:Transcript_134169/g.304259  ORF Transcript_134169/g.304259 Transcript_134169/m.304259 type:complete len:399 (-) Transcript_134169:1803-2999(-)